MCADQTNAARETHSTIVAPLVISTQAGAQTTTASLRGVTTSLSTATETRATVSNGVLPPSRGTSILSQHQGSPSRTGNNDAPTSTTLSASSHSSAQTERASGSANPQKGGLSVSQIAGICVGSAGVLLFVLALWVLLRYRRRRASVLEAATLNLNTAANVSRSGREKEGHELQISPPVNLQPPRQQRPYVAPWHEKISLYSPRGPGDYTPKTGLNPLTMTAPELAVVRPTMSRSEMPRPAIGRPNSHYLGSLTSEESPTRPNQPREQSTNIPDEGLSGDIVSSSASRRRSGFNATIPMGHALNSVHGGHQNYRRQQNPQQQNPQLFQPPPINRDSAVTEFAEDGEDELSPRTSSQSQQQFSGLEKKMFMAPGRPRGANGWGQGWGQSRTGEFPSRPSAEPQAIQDDRYIASYDNTRRQPSIPAPVYREGSRFPNQSQPRNRNYSQANIRSSPSRGPFQAAGEGALPPFGSPSLVPRPLDLAPRLPSRNPMRNSMYNQIGNERHEPPPKVPQHENHGPHPGGYVPGWPGNRKFPTDGTYAAVELPQRPEAASRLWVASQPSAFEYDEPAGGVVSRMAKMRLGDNRAANLRLRNDDELRQPKQQASKWRRMEGDRVA